MGRRDQADGGEGFPQFEHNAYTFEGEIERLGAIGRNLSTAPRWARRSARIVAIVMLAPMVLAIVFSATQIFLR